MDFETDTISVRFCLCKKCRAICKSPSDNIDFFSFIYVLIRSFHTDCGEFTSNVFRWISYTVVFVSNKVTSTHISDWAILRVQHPNNMIDVNNFLIIRYQKKEWLLCQLITHTAWRITRITEEHWENFFPTKIIPLWWSQVWIEICALICDIRSPIQQRTKYITNLPDWRAFMDNHQREMLRAKGRK